MKNVMANGQLKFSAILPAIGRGKWVCSGLGHGGGVRVLLRRFPPLGVRFQLFPILSRLLHNFKVYYFIATAFRAGKY